MWLSMRRKYTTGHHTHVIVHLRWVYLELSHIKLDFVATYIGKWTCQLQIQVELFFDYKRIGRKQKGNHVQVNFFQWYLNAFILYFYVLAGCPKRNFLFPPPNFFLEIYLNIYIIICRILYFTLAKWSTVSRITTAARSANGIHPFWKTIHIEFKGCISNLVFLSNFNSIFNIQCVLL